MPQHQFTVSTMNKNLPKLVKYIFLSNKQRTRVWFLKYRDFHMHFPSIGGENIDFVQIVLAGKICTIINFFIQPTRKTYKSPTSASDE